MEETKLYILGFPNLREMVATAAWYLWFEHRKVYHGEEIQTPTQIDLSVHGLAANFSIACSPKAKFWSGIWEKPPKGYMKLNVDAGFDQDLLE